MRVPQHQQQEKEEEEHHLQALLHPLFVHQGPVEQAFCRFSGRRVKTWGQESET